MKKIALIGLVVVAAGLAWVSDSEAGGRHFHHGHHHHHGFHSRVFIGFGPVFHPYPYVYYPRPAVVYAPPPVVVQEPPVYVQQSPPPAVAPAPPASYWYYCPSAGAYYPSVPTCNEAWVQVAPR